MYKTCARRPHWTIREAAQAEIDALLKKHKTLTVVPISKSKGKKLQSFMLHTLKPSGEVGPDGELMIERAKMQARTSTFVNVTNELGHGAEFFLDTYLKYLVASTAVNGSAIIGL